MISKGNVKVRTIVKENEIQQKKKNQIKIKLGINYVLLRTKIIKLKLNPSFQLKHFDPDIHLYK